MLLYNNRIYKTKFPQLYIYGVSITIIAIMNIITISNSAPIPVNTL